MISWSDKIICIPNGVAAEQIYPKKLGVYLIGEKNYTGRIITRYVGKGDILQRMQAHHSESESNEELKKLMLIRNGDVVVIYSKVDDQTNASNLEFTLFSKFGGLNKLYNKITPEGNLLENVNTPSDFLVG